MCVTIEATNCLLLVDGKLTVYNGGVKMRNRERVKDKEWENVGRLSELYSRLQQITSTTADSGLGKTISIMYLKTCS